jgi:hypothetical protein
MQARSVRIAATALLLASGLLAGFFLWTLEQRTNSAMAAGSNASARLGHLSDIIAGIGTAQQSYVAPGQLDEPWFERASALTAELSRELQLAQQIFRSPAAAGVLRQLADAVETLSAADARTRQNLQLGQELMASDVIFSDGRNLLDAMILSLRRLQTDEQAAMRAEIDGLARQRWIGLGAVALLWMVTLLSLLASGPRPAAITLNLSGEGDAQRPAAPQPRIEQTGGVDLTAAASLCTELSRITTTAALPGLLGRAAEVLDAPGLILWISAGEQLFPVMGHGYQEEMVSRLGPIARDAENAAARAWRTGQLTSVPASTGGGYGAIVAPLFGVHSCIGVLSAEVRQGEDSPAAQAIAAIIAAQLSTIVPAWPAGSLSPEARSA